MEVIQTTLRVAVISRKKMKKTFLPTHVLWQVLQEWCFTQYQWCGDGGGTGQYRGSGLTGLFKSPALLLHPELNCSLPQFPHLL